MPWTLGDINKNRPTSCSFIGTLYIVASESSGIRVVQAVREFVDKASRRLVFRAQAACLISHKPVVRLAGKSETNRVVQAIREFVANKCISSCVIFCVAECH